MSALIISADALNVDDLRAPLTTLGLAVQHVPAIIAVPEALATRAPDLVIVVLPLPGQDVGALLNLLRTHTATRDQPLVAVIAELPLRIPGRVLRRFDALIVTPFDDEDVLRAIEGLLPSDRWGQV